MEDFLVTKGLRHFSEGFSKKLLGGFEPPKPPGKYATDRGGGVSPRNSGLRLAHILKRFGI
jgi:hypothetical protein